MMRNSFPVPYPHRSAGRKRFSDRGLKFSFSIARGKLVSALRVTFLAVYGSRVLSTYASFSKCRISHFARVALRWRSSSIHRIALYRPVRRAMLQASHSYQFMTSL